jgi:hypothetical protein
MLVVQRLTTVVGDARPAIVFATPITLLLVGSVVVHDLASIRRVHGATAWGLLCFFALGQAITAALMFSGAWGGSGSATTWLISNFVAAAAAEPQR